MSGYQLGHLKHADLLLAIEYGFESFVGVDEGALFGVLQLVFLDVVPELFGELGAGEGFGTNHCRQFGVGLDGFQKCSVCFSFYGFFGSDFCSWFFNGFFRGGFGHALFCRGKLEKRQINFRKKIKARLGSLKQLRKVSSCIGDHNVSHAFVCDMHLGRSGESRGRLRAPDFVTTPAKNHPEKDKKINRLVSPDTLWQDEKRQTETQ